MLAAYPPLLPLQCKRLAARRHAVTYCYDFPAVFENALRDIWAQRSLAGGTQGEEGWGGCVCVLKFCACVWACAVVGEWVGDPGPSVRVLLLRVSVCLKP